MNFVNRLISEHPDIKFIISARFQWSPEDKVIYYNPTSPKPEWSLLHELGHVRGGHVSYRSDIGLLKMEVEAWQKARELARNYGIQISENHIEKCLDSYRDWLYKRSSCPACSQAGLEKITGQYQCINCSESWQVTPERFCRVYRKTVPSLKA